MKITRPAGALALLLAAVLSGCSTYDSRYAFEPRPAETTLQAPGGVPVAQALASVVGVRRAAPADGIEASVEVRLRIDSVSDRPMRFNPASMSLLSADLQKFPPPQVDPPGMIEITRTQPAEVIARFPFPSDPSRPPMDLSGLNVRWSVDVDQTPVPGSVTVKRRRYRAPPHWLYGWHFGYGYHGHHHHGHGVHFGFRGYR